MSNQTITLANVATATTGDLLAFFNAHSGKAPVARFADRKTAIARVSALLAAITPSLAEVAAAVKATSGKATSPATAMAEKAIRKGVAADRAAARTLAKQERAAAERDQDQCPSCGATEDQTRAGLDGTKAGEERNFCHHCNTEYWFATGKIYHAPAASASRSAAIAKSWQDPATLAARSERTAVRVHGIDAKGQKVSADFKSVAKAFAAFGFQSSGIIRTRMQLKAFGTLNVNGFTFTALAAE